MRRTTTVVTAALAVALAAAVVVTVVARDDASDSAAGGRSTPTPSPTPSSTWDGGVPNTADDVVSAYHRLHPDVPRDVIARRVALNLPRKALLTGFGEEPSFATSWYDYGTGLWHLLGTDQARLDAWAARARAAGIDPAPRLVEYSSAELDARAARIESGQDPLSRFSRQAGVDLPTNRVHVVVAERPDVDDDMVVWVDYVGVPYAEARPG